MRAKFIFEKFTEDSDPIHDMGIGMEAQIKDYINKKNQERQWSKIDVKDTEDVIRQCIYDEKHEFVKYLIENRNDYDKDEVLHRLIRNKFNIDIIDFIIKKGAKFENLEQKMIYVEGLKGKLFTLTPEEKLIAASKMGNFADFKKYIEKGTLLKIGMLNSIFKKDWSYASGAKGQYDKIIDYLRDNIDKLDEIVHPRDHKKLDKIKKYLGIDKTKAYKTYPGGYKIYRLLKYINENNVTDQKELSKLVFEISNGPNSWNPLLHASYWNDYFKADSFYKSVDIKNGVYKLSAYGKAKLDKYEAKFGKMKIKAYV